MHLTLRLQKQQIPIISTKLGVHSGIVPHSIKELLTYTNKVVGFDGNINPYLLKYNESQISNDIVEANSIHFDYKSIHNASS